MFCKWCGNGIQLTDKKCPNCGRETPPMSDCGGFYNLKHSNDGPTVPTKEKVVVKEVPHCAAVEKMDAKYVKERKAAKKHHAITMSCFIVILLAIVCSALLILCVSNQLGELKEQIDNIQIEIPTYPTEAPLDKPNDEQVTDPLEESTRYSFTINTTVVNGDSKEISNTYDFGNYAKSVKVTTTSAQGENNQAFTVSYLLDEEAYVNLNLKYVQENAELLTIGMNCDTDLSFFNDQEFSYEWLYRTESGDWLSVDQKHITENDGYYSLLCDEDLWSNLGEKEALKDIRCVIKIKDIKGNMMTITVDGCGLSQDVSLR